MCTAFVQRRPHGPMAVHAHTDRGWSGCQHHALFMAFLSAVLHLMISRVVSSAHADVGVDVHTGWYGGSYYHKGQFVRFADTVSEGSTAVAPGQSNGPQHVPAEMVSDLPRSGALNAAIHVNVTSLGASGGWG